MVERLEQCERRVRGGDRNRLRSGLCGVGDCELRGGREQVREAHEQRRRTRAVSGAGPIHRLHLGAPQVVARRLPAERVEPRDELERQRRSRETRRAALAYVEILWFIILL